MKFRVETNLYDMPSVAQSMRETETQFAVVDGKINSLVSESELTELNDSKSTMYHKLSAMEQTVDGLKSSVTEYKDNTINFQTPYTDDGDTVSITAKIYQSGLDVTDNYKDGCFEWYRKCDDGEEFLGYGKSLTVQKSDYQYGGEVHVIFLNFVNAELVTPDFLGLLTPDGKLLTAWCKGDRSQKLEREISIFKPDSIANAFKNVQSQSESYTNSQVKQMSDSIATKVSQTYTTKSESDNMNTEVRSYTDTQLKQMKDELDISITQKTSAVSNDLRDYQTEVSSYFKFATDGLTIGKRENNNESPFEILINNEKMSFLQDKYEVAYVQYNKMHINEIEAVSRWSVGAKADGGFFDFISTKEGMGVKWRSVKE